MQTHNRTDRHDTARNRPGAENRHYALVLEAGLIAALCVFFASLAPGVVFAAALSSLLSTASLLVGAVALLRMERPTVTALSHWDVALALLALSIAAGWFVDPQAISAFVEAQGLASGAGAS